MCIYSMLMHTRKRAQQALVHARNMHSARVHSTPPSCGGRSASIRKKNMNQINSTYAMHKKTCRPQCPFAARAAMAQSVRGGRPQGRKKGSRRCVCVSPTCVFAADAPPAGAFTPTDRKVQKEKRGSVSSDASRKTRSQTGVSTPPPATTLLRRVPPCAVPASLSWRNSGRLPFSRVIALGSLAL